MAREALWLVVVVLLVMTAGCTSANSVFGPSPLLASSMTVDPANPNVGEVALVTINVTNPAKGPSKGILVLMAGEAEVGKVELNVPGNATVTRSFTLTPGVGGRLILKASVGASELVEVVVVGEPRIAEANWQFFNSWCSEHFEFAVTFTNSGTGTAREVEVEVQLLDENDAEVDFEVKRADPVPAGKKATVMFELSAPDRCGESDWYHAKITIRAPRLEAVVVQTEAFAS